MVRVTTTEVPARQAMTLRLPPEDYEVLRAIAFERHVSINEVVCELVHALVETSVG